MVKQFRAAHANADAHENDEDDDEGSKDEEPEEAIVEDDEAYGNSDAAKTAVNDKLESGVISEPLEVMDTKETEEVQLNSSSTPL